MDMSPSRLICGGWYSMMWRVDRSVDTAVPEAVAAEDLDDRAPPVTAVTGPGQAADSRGAPGAAAMPRAPGGTAGPGAPPRGTRPPQPDLSVALVEAQQGSEEAFRLLYRDIQPRVLRYLRALVSEDAEDVASETWLHVARDLRTFRGDLDAFRGWVATIARNRATDHLRKVSRRPKPASVTAEELVYFASGDDTAIQAMDSVATDTAMALIQGLPRDQAEAVLLRVVVGLDAKSAGQVLGKRPGAVRTAAYRGLRRLADLLQQQGTGADGGIRGAGVLGGAGGRQ
jgi:RNA polymerase sigma-70 factor (ECF subfamily)